MSSITTKPVKLVHSHPIKPGTTRKKDLEIYPHKKKRREVIKGEVLDKTIHSYRMWFLFLKLGLELEQQRTILVMKEPSGRRRRVEGSGGSDGGGMFKYETLNEHITRKVKVNRKKYDGWDLDQVLTSTFDKWWKGHRHLFTDQVSKTLEPGETSSTDSNYITIQFDKRRRLSDVITDLREMNKDGLFKKQERNRFVVRGRVRPLTLLNRYNCLLLKLEDRYTNREIIEHPNFYIRPTEWMSEIPGVKKGHGYYSSYHYPRTVFDLISGGKNVFGAKQILLSVCDGYFISHPTKTYV